MYITLNRFCEVFCKNSQRVKCIHSLNAVGTSAEAERETESIKIQPYQKHIYIYFVVTNSNSWNHILLGELGELRLKLEAHQDFELLAGSCSVPWQIFGFEHCAGSPMATHGR